MSNEMKSSPQPDWTGPGLDNVKLVYFLYFLGFVFGGVPTLIGVVFAYINRPKSGDVAASHYTWQVRTFWIGILYGLISVALMLIGIGFLLMIAIAVWVIVRCVKGLQWAARDEAVPDPETWLV